MLVGQISDNGVDTIRDTLYGEFGTGVVGRVGECGGARTCET